MDDTRDTGPMHAPQAPQELPAPFEPAARATDELARDIAAHHRVGPRRDLGAGILRRYDTSGAPGLHATRLGQRFAPRKLRAGPLELTVSPYAPPQRQLSTVRQGAPMWRPEAAAPPAPFAGPDERPERAEPVTAPPRAAPTDPSELPADLRALLALHRARGHI
ncbi:MAG: hypothetical protein OHK0015_43830 [Chloroflexi bacterium OHK40]